MSLLPRKGKKNLPSWKILGNTDVLMDALFPDPYRQLVMLSEEGHADPGVNLQQLTTCGSLIYKTHPLI